jgi:hypothetical protein
MLVSGKSALRTRLVVPVESAGDLVTAIELRDARRLEEVSLKN